MSIYGKLTDTSNLATLDVSHTNSRLFVSDVKSGIRFLIDTGATTSCFPRRLVNSKFCKLSEFELFAANESKIKTYGSKHFELDFGFKKLYPFWLTVADLSHPILGVDFLERYGLLVDVKNRRLIDTTTSTSIKGLPCPGSSIGVTTTSKNSPYSELLLKYPNLTSSVLNRKSCTNNVTHCIETRGPPVFSNFRRLSPEKLIFLKKEFNELLKQGIIRPSKSPWSSPIHLVSKKTGGWRVCGDFRRLNAVTIPDRYPIPHVQDFSYNLSGNKIFSKIDLVKAYHQIKIEDSDIPKTAVITPIGLYEYVYMCFGLKNAGQTFQRYMDNILRDIDCAFAYLDDILISSPDEATHKADLERVFKRLNDNGIVINLPKCVFAQRELPFLGFLVSEKGISPLPNKVKVILEYPRPKTVEHLRRFLAMINFYHRFLRNASQVQAKLHDLVKGKTKKDKTELVWSEETNAVFLACKEMIANAALLAHPVLNSKISLVVDASDSAVGAVLQMTDRNETRPLGFFSRKLTNAEINYSTYDRELLAIYSAIKYFKHMIEGRQFTVFTDHRPLTHAFTQKSDKCSPRQIRHLELIGQYTTDIQYIKGQHNTVADTLSRIEGIELGSTIDYDAMSLAQEVDEELQSILQSESNLKLKPIVFSTNKKPLLCDVSTANIRPYVPKEFRKQVFDVVHGLSHPGFRATLRLIKNRFVWNAMSKDCKKWCETCLQCQRSKITRHTKTPFGNFALPKHRFSHIHLDVVGPLPPSKDFRYILTCVDRFSRWPEAFPMRDQTAETVADVFMSGWIARFGVPELLTTDQGRNFESTLFRCLSKFIGAEKTRTTAYNPKSNGSVERFHRQLKSAIKCHNTEKWSEVLPMIMLGIRTSLKEDLGVSAAEMVYGEPLRLPGEFFRNSNIKDLPSAGDFLQNLRDVVKNLRPVPASRHGSKDIFIHRDLFKTTHVFLRVDSVRRPLQQPYQGPYKVISRKDKFFTIEINGKHVCVSVDRLKPAFLLAEEKTLEPDKILKNSTDDPYITKRGRRVRFVIPYQA